MFARYRRADKRRVGCNIIERTIILCLTVKSSQHHTVCEYGVDRGRREQQVKAIGKSFNWNLRLRAKWTNRRWFSAVMSSTKWRKCIAFVLYDNRCDKMCVNERLMSNSKMHYWQLRGCVLQTKYATKYCIYRLQDLKLILNQ